MRKTRCFDWCLIFVAAFSFMIIVCGCSPETFDEAEASARFKFEGFLDVDGLNTPDQFETEAARYDTAGYFGFRWYSKTFDVDSVNVTVLINKAWYRSDKVRSRGNWKLMPESSIEREYRTRDSLARAKDPGSWE